MHCAIYGMTESGKSTLAKRMIVGLRANGHYCIVLDPNKDPSFNADFQTKDPQEFEGVWKDSRQCFCFIDEAGHVGKFSETIKEAATRGRHWGHSFVFISQKATQVEPLVRDQCSGLYLFRSGLQSRKILADEYDCTELLEPLQMLEYHTVIKGEYKGKKRISF